MSAAAARRIANPYVTLLLGYGRVPCLLPRTLKTLHALMRALHAGHLAQCRNWRFACNLRVGSNLHAFVVPYQSANA